HTHTHTQTHTHSHITHKVSFTAQILVFLFILLASHSFFLVPYPLLSLSLSPLSPLFPLSSPIFSLSSSHFARICFLLILSPSTSIHSPLLFSLLCSPCVSGVERPTQGHSPT